MTSTKWHFPKNFEEAMELTKMDAAFFHSGGTSISSQMMNKWAHVVDTHDLPIYQLNIENGQIYLGAGLTFNEVVRKLDAERTGHLLSKALVNSSSAPLRNRITLGGSIAAFPTWSDLMGPLIALKANIHLMDDPQIQIPITDYIENRVSYKKMLITGISIADTPLFSFYHRETRVQFDYPAFTVSITAQFKSRICNDANIVVIGTRNKYVKLKALCNTLIGMAAEEIKSIDVDALVELKFNKKELGSGSYVAKVAIYRIKQGLITISGEAK